MFAQLDPMKQIVNELKKDRDSSMKKIAGIEKDISGLIQKFKVSKKHERKHWKYFMLCYIQMDQLFYGFFTLTESISDTVTMDAD